MKRIELCELVLQDLKRLQAVLEGNPPEDAVELAKRYIASSTSIWIGISRNTKKKESGC